MTPSTPSPASASGRTRCPRRDRGRMVGEVTIHNLKTSGNAVDVRNTTSTFRINQLPRRSGGPDAARGSSRAASGPVVRALPAVAFLRQTGCNRTARNLHFLRYSCAHDATTCSSGEEGGSQRGNGQPGAQRQAGRLGGDPPVRAHRPRRPRLRASHPAAGRARAAGRAGPAGTPEPHLPGLRRGHRRRAGAAGTDSGAVHADHRRRLRGRLRRAAAPAAGVRRGLRRAGSSPRPTPRTTTTGCSPSARSRWC